MRGHPLAPSVNLSSPMALIAHHPPSRIAMPSPPRLPSPLPLSLMLLFLAAPALAQPAASTPTQSSTWPSSPPAEDPFGSALAPAPNWSELSARERSALAPLSAYFDRLDSQQRRKWRALAERSQRWTPEQLARAQSRMALWAQMSPEQRASARQQALASPRADSRARADSWRRWEDMDKERRLRESAQAPSPARLALPDAGSDPRPK